MKQPFTHSRQIDPSLPARAQTTDSSQSTMESLSLVPDTSLISSSVKFLKLRKLLKNFEKMEHFSSPIATTPGDHSLMILNKKLDLSKDFLLYFSIIKKPLNLLFSIDQFLFEFSKKKYQQKKTGEFLQQLKERKKLSFFYGSLTRKQILNLFKKAKTFQGSFSATVFSLLERRLDLVLYRSGLTKTVVEARQLIKHKKIQVNQNIINMPSYGLNPGDLISMAWGDTKTLKSPLKSKISFSNNVISTNGVACSSQTFQDFYLKLQKTLNETHGSIKKNSHSCKKISILKSFYKFPPLESDSAFLEKTESLRNRLNQELRNSPSKFLCKRLIRLLCTRAKLRCFFTLKECLGIHVMGMLETSRKESSRKKQLLIRIKSKSFSGKKKPTFVKKNLKKNQPIFIYANQGVSQKTPEFSNLHHTSTPLAITRKLSSHGNKQQNYFKGKEFKTIQQGDTLHSRWRGGKRILKMSHYKRTNLDLYRESFIFFLRCLSNSSKFQKFLDLKLKNSFYSKNHLSVKKPPFLHVKPMHLEISYSLMNFVYLYSPQRIHFPFFIDLELIRRSLR